jgi:large subunit ribosomal protein L10
LPQHEHKSVVIDGLAKKFTSSSAAIVADYRGFTVAELAQIRSQLRPADVELKIAKNTLARRAAAQSNIAGADDLLTGPTAIAFCNGDFRTGTKALNDFVRTSRKPFVVRGAIVGRNIVPAEGVGALQTVPTEAVLYAQVVGGIQAPVARFVSVLSATLSGLLSVLRQHAEQQGGTFAQET